MFNNSPFLLEATGARSACLLLHGLGGGVYEMRTLGEVVHQLGVTVQGINYPGHDRPAPKMPTSSWEDWYGHILATYEKLAQQYPEIIIIGFSTGCPLGLHLAANHPVTKLVLLSPYLAIRHRPYFIFRPEAYLFSLGRFLVDLPRLRLPIRDAEMRQHAEKALFFRTFNLNAVRSANQLIARVKPELAGIKTPTLIIQSRRDNVVDPPGAEAIYQTLGSEIKKLVWLQRSDHIIQLDVEREVVFAEVKDFVLT